MIFKEPDKGAIHYNSQLDWHGYKRCNEDPSNLQVHTEKELKIVFHL